jgi:hypothetical protein
LRDPLKKRFYWNWMLWTWNVLKKQREILLLLLLLLLLLRVYWSRGSVVGIGTGYGPDDRGVGFWVPVGSRIFSSPHRPDRLWGPPNLIYNRYRLLFSRGIKRPGSKAYHSPPASAEFKKMWTYTSTT